MQDSAGVVSAWHGVCRWWYDVPTWCLAVLSHVLCVSWYRCHLWSRQYYDILAVPSHPALSVTHMHVHT